MIARSADGLRTSVGSKKVASPSSFSLAPANNLCSGRARFLDLAFHQHSGIRIGERSHRGIRIRWIAQFVSADQLSGVFDERLEDIGMGVDSLNTAAGLACVVHAPVDHRFSSYLWIGIAGNICCVLATEFEVAIEHGLSAMAADRSPPPQPNR